MKFRLLYIPRGIVGPRGDQLETLTIDAAHALHAAQKARSFERRSGNLVLTVKEEKR